jgi:hypothetical protein
MNQVRGGVSYPDFHFPRDVAEIAAHGRPVGEGGHINQAGRRLGEKPPKLCMAFSVHGAVTGDGFDQQQPVPFRVIQNNVRHLAMGIDTDAKLCQQHRVEVTPLLARVAGIDQDASGNKTRPEVLNDGPYQFAMLAGAESDFLAGAIFTGIRFCLRS